MSTPAHPSSSHPTRPPVVGPRKKILVVDDDVDSARLVAHVLSRDYDVVLAFDGPSGIDAAVTSPPDLLVADIAMPGMDGVTMVTHIRAASQHRFPVLFLTARHAPSDVVAAIAAGARGFLTKPVEFGRFEETVRRALREHR